MPEGKSVKDVSEWVTYGFERKLLLALVEDTPEWKPDEPHTGATAIREFDDIPDLTTLDIKPVQYIVAGIIPRGTVTLLTGDPGVGKSYLLFALGIALARGTDFLGRATEQTKVLILDRENPNSLQLERQWKIAKGAEPSLKVWGQWLPDPPPMLGDPRLVEIAKVHKPTMIFDSLVRFHEGDENDASEMRDVMSFCRTLAAAGTTVVLIHHRPKSPETKYRGSTDILAAVDQAYAVSPMAKADFRCTASKADSPRSFPSPWSQTSRQANLPQPNPHGIPQAAARSKCSAPLSGNTPE